MRRLGFSPEMKGYAYAIYIIQVVYSLNGERRLSAKESYDKIAKEFKTTPTAAEKGLRNAIESAWAKGDPDFSEKIFGCSISAEKGKPTNLQFVYTMADYMKRNK